MVAVYSFLWILLCALLQVLVFNHISLMGGVVLIYLIALIKMPVQINRSLQILMGFACGLLVDIFSNSIGLHALTCTTIMWMRLPLLHMYVIADEIKTGVPSMDKLSTPLFVRYVITVIAVHTVLLYLIESFTLFNILPLLLKIVVTAVLTFLFTMAFEMAVTSKK